MENFYVDLFSHSFHSGIKLPEASKILAKKFACGCAVTKGVVSDEITIQGDYTDDLIEVLLEKFNITQDSVEVDNSKKKDKK